VHTGFKVDRHGSALASLSCGVVRKEKTRLVDLYEGCATYTQCSGTTKNFNGMKIIFIPL
jgi:hypothetical protein